MFKFITCAILSAVLSNIVFDLPAVQEYTNIIQQYAVKTYFNLPAENTQHLLTAEELATYNGEDGKPLYLSIIGQVYDVTKGARFYGKGETYHVFVGRDNSRSFVSGNLEEADISDNVIPMTQAEFRSLNHWAQFYKKEYTKIGKLIGRYYNSNGKLTPYGREVKLLIKEAELAQADENAEKLKFPPCNIEWDPQSGTRVWCTSKSGGIERDWVGVPRELYVAGSEKRCACIHEGNKNLGNIKEYPGCSPDAISCQISNE